WLHVRLPSTFSEYDMDGAATNGHLNVIKWLHEHRSEGCTHMAPFHAARHGHLEVIQWLHAHYPDKFVRQAMDQAAGNGHLHIVRWLHENCREGCTAYAMYLAARNGHLNVMLYLLEHRSEGFPSNVMTAAHNFEVQCLFSSSRPLSLKTDRSHRVHEPMIVLQSAYNKRPAFVKDCLRCLAQIATCEGNIEILDWLNQLGLELRTTIPIRDAVARGNVQLLQWFYSNQFELQDPDLLELAVQKGQLDAARWLSKRGFKITSLNLIEEAGRNDNVSLLRWLVEHGPPLDFDAALVLTGKYHHEEIVPMVSESVRVLLVCEALQSSNRNLVWHILVGTRIEDENSRETIRDAIQHASSSMLRWIEDSSICESCVWCLPALRKRRASEMGLVDQN
ncbi:hypothetical protein F442_10317, partial [Phytophthora nicotianae P10297]